MNKVHVYVFNFLCTSKECAPHFSYECIPEVYFHLAEFTLDLKEKSTEEELSMGGGCW